MNLRASVLLTTAVLGLALLGVWLFARAALIEVQRLLDRDTIKAFVERAGVWGPLMIIGLMAIAVVASPVPNAPIALGAGAAYGHLWGTVQVALGALIAFGLARAIGRNGLRRLFGDRVDAGLFESQTALMTTCSRAA